MKLFKKLFLSCFCLLFSIIVFYGNANVALANDNELYLGGIPAGFVVKSSGATVIALSDVITDEEISSPSKMSDIKVGDIILSVDGISISGAENISEALKDCNGNPVEVIILRDNKKITKYITPKKDKFGIYKLGVFVRDDLNGIGTITYFTENGNFCALGHPVVGDNGKDLEILGGEAYYCSIIGVSKGEKGKAGELKGIFIDDRKIGDITKNTPTGLYGTAIESFDYKNFRKVELGEAVMGEATIYTCIDAITPKEYKIEIVKTDKNNRDNKNLVIKIIDKELLDYTNGILQGMSGSPIIQNDKIVGAVTHVFINDPTRGFGISIDKMLKN